jgi:hypothetical protein
MTSDVKRPGLRGGRWYRTRTGRVRYGVSPGPPAWVPVIEFGANDVPDPNAVVRGVVRYNGRRHYELDTSTDGTRVLLATTDGSKQFWADKDQVETLYDGLDTPLQEQIRRDRRRRAEVRYFRYLPTKYRCAKNHGGNTRLASGKLQGRRWVWCVGCHTFYAPEELPRLLRDRPGPQSAAG